MCAGPPVHYEQTVREENSALTLGGKDSQHSIADNSCTIGPRVHVHATVWSRGLHSFPFPLNLSILCPFPLNVSLLCPPHNPNIPVDVSRRCSN